MRARRAWVVLALTVVAVGSLVGCSAHRMPRTEAPAPAPDVEEVPFVQSFDMVRAGGAGASDEHAAPAPAAPQPSASASTLRHQVETASKEAVIGGVPGGVIRGVIGGTVGGVIGYDSPPGWPEVPPFGSERAGESYRHVTESAFRSPLIAPLSTFGVDVDTASYAIVRSYLTRGRLPPPDAVRAEEFVNAFRYHDVVPSGTDVLAATTEVSDCPWAPGHRLVRIALRTPDIDDRDVPPRNLVFLLDVSGSMEGKLPLLKAALRLLASRLRPEDTVAIVTFARVVTVALEPTPGGGGSVLAAIDSLVAEGSTDGAGALEAAYALIAKHHDPAAINRVILATDGDFNEGPSSEGELVRLIEAKRAKGIYLTVLGFGRGNLQDSKLELLADHGDGNYAYIDTLEEANRVLAAEAAGTLMTCARDVKVQVEVNPGRVASYRLIGYENRAMPDEHFADDAKDGGEMGFGQSVTALYELVPLDASTSAAAAPLRYQSRQATEPAWSSELMHVKLRWKLPEDDRSDELEAPVLDERVTFGSATDDLRWSAACAAFAMLLRGTEHAGRLTWPELERLATAAAGRDADGRRSEMIALIRAAAKLQAEAAAPTRG